MPRAPSAVALALGLLLAVGCTAPGPVEAGLVGLGAIDPDGILAHVEVLTDDRLEGRRMGSPGCEEAAAYVAARFAELDLRPAGPFGSYLQNFLAVTGPRLDPETGLAVENESIRQPTANVVAFLPGTGELRREVVVVASHYDGGGGSDDSSGIAALLEVAEAFTARREELERTVVFLAFAGKPLGLLGSTHYVLNPSFPMAQTVAMVSLDGVGRSHEGDCAVAGSATSASFTGLPQEVNEALTLGLALDLGDGPSPPGTSDAQPFLEAGVPSLSLSFGGTVKDLPPPDDAGVSYAALTVRIARLAYGIATAIEQLPERPTFQRPAVASPPEGDAATEESMP